MFGEECDLNLWDLKRLHKRTQQFYQAAYRHDLSKLNNLWCASVKDDVNNQSQVNMAHMFACGQGQGGLRGAREVLHWLVDRGANLDALDAHDWLPLNYACFFALPVTVDVLLEAGVGLYNSCAPQPLDSALQAASQRPNSAAETCARLLLLHGADPKKGLSSDPHWGGVTWLTWALINDRFDWAELLYHKGLEQLSSKEKQLLLVRGSIDSLVWAEEKGMDLASRVLPSHPAYGSLKEAGYRQTRAIINKALGDTPSEAGNDETDEKGRRKM